MVLNYIQNNIIISTKFKFFLSLAPSLYFGNLTKLTINKAGKICIMEQMQKTFFFVFALQ